MYGDRHLGTDNEPNAVAINYYLKNKGNEKAKITVTDPYGVELAKLEGKTDAGINTVLWNMRRPMTRPEASAPQMQRAADPFGSLVPPGEYVVILEVAGRKLTQKARITKRTGWPIGMKSEIYQD